VIVAFWGRGDYIVIMRLYNTCNGWCAQEGEQLGYLGEFDLDRWLSLDDPIRDVKDEFAATGKSPLAALSPMLPVTSQEIMMEINTSSAAAQASDEDAPLCPACGYDLRGTIGDRCSECGETFDRALLSTSALPWARYRQVGSVRAYLRTVWLITIGSPALAHEVSKQHDAHCARIFRRITGVILGIILAGAFVATEIGAGGLWFVAVQPDPVMLGNPAAAHWIYDLLVPWSAGATIPGIIPLMLMLLGFQITRSQEPLFRLPGASPRRQQSLTAVASYTVAPMVWLLPAVLFIVAARMVLFVVAGRITHAGPLLTATFVLLLIGLAFGAIGFAASAVRGVQWAVRCRHAGLGRAGLAVAQLFALWLGGLLLILGLLPWCVGFLWIVIDSFR